jgi:hypothetical protein
MGSQDFIQQKNPVFSIKAGFPAYGSSFKPRLPFKAVALKVAMCGSCPRLRQRLACDGFSPSFLLPAGAD